MRNLTITIMCLCLFGYSFAQINVSIDGDRLMHNSAIMSKAMIEALGEDSVKQILNNNIRFVFVYDVDSLGYVNKTIKIISKQQEISNNLIVCMENYLISNKIQFYICYANDPPDIPKTLIIEEVRERFKNNESVYVCFGFPGDLMNLYEYEKEKAMETVTCLSKYDYLLMQISKIFN